MPEIEAQLAQRVAALNKVREAWRLRGKGAGPRGGGALSLRGRRPAAWTPGNKGLESREGKGVGMEIGPGGLCGVGAEFSSLD